MSGRSPRILISAGEASGDLHGAALARALRARWPDAELYGFGGDGMRAAGVTLWAHANEMAVMGFAEVARHLPFFLGLLRRVRRHLDEAPPDLVIPIDYPGFNLRLARAARERRVPVLYYIAPQVWAWHRSRMRQLAQHTDKLAVVLPFEEPLFREAGADVHFVGHPLLDLSPPAVAREELCAQVGIDPRRRILALLPGSRRQEVRSHAELFSTAAARVQQSMPDVIPVVAQAPGIEDSELDTPFPRTQATRALLEHAHAALTKSGTSTLDCALAVVPMVIAYRMHPLTYRIARRLVRVEHIGLVNLIAGRRVAPELIQDEATADRLAAELLPLLEDGAQRARTLAELRTVRERLAPPDARPTARHVADLAAELIEPL